MDSMEDYFIKFLEDSEDSDIIKLRHDNPKKIMQAAPTSIILYLEGEPVIELTTEGFYVRGEKVTDDVQIYEAFRDFLRDQGYYLK